jgi:hypothetical protein
VGNGQGVTQYRQTYIWINGVQVSSDPFEFLFTVPSTPRDSWCCLLKVLYRFKVIDKAEAEVGLKRSRLISQKVEELNGRSLHGQYLKRERDRNVKQKPTYDRTSQYNPVMKGKSYRGKR